MSKLLPYVTTGDIADAKERVLHNADTVADFIAAACAREAQGFVAVRRKIAEATPEDFKHLSISALLALALEEHQPAPVVKAAMQAIGERVLADDDIQAFTIQLANEIAEAREDEMREAA